MPTRARSRFLIICSLPLLVLTAQSNQSAIHICDLAQNLGSYDGRIVAVRGTYFAGPHGSTVAAEKCQKRTPFRKIGSGIAISLDTNITEGYTVPGPNGQAYEVDRNALDEFWRIAYSDGETTATFVGVLSVKRGFKLRALRPSRWEPHPGYEGNGYGQMGFYPAELSVITIRDAISESARDK